MFNFQTVNSFVTSAIPFLKAFILLVLSAFLPAEASAQHQVSLFNGKDLSQWTKADGSPVSQGWIVDSGSLHRSERGGDIFYQHEVGDFVFDFEFKISENGNSGIKYRVKKFGNAWLGCEYQILDDAKKDAKKHIAGALYAVYEPQNKPPVKPEVWNRGRIVVQNNRIEHWLNGRLVVTADVGSSDWKQRVQASKFRNNKGFGENQTGRIMLQDHGNKVWFRNLYITHLNRQNDFDPHAPMPERWSMLGQPTHSSVQMNWPTQSAPMATGPCDSGQFSTWSQTSGQCCPSGSVYYFEHNRCRPVRRPFGRRLFCR